VHLLASDAGLCAVYFNPQIDEMGKRFPSRLRKGGRGNPWLLRAEAFLVCYLEGDLEYQPDIALDLQGTPFQHRVWEALQRIGPAQTRTYGELARQIGCPDGARAVGAAVGQNPVSILVPCHRMVGADGRLAGYGGGLELKRYLLDHERRHALR
jgi:methylated-DNA-[protein]-cysteine S-methyltransferase